MIMKSLAMRLFPALLLLSPGTALTDNHDFSIVVVPDTQLYAEQYPAIIDAQMQWIVDNKDNENIIYVAQLGDLKDDLNCNNKLIAFATGGDRTEWDVVDQAFNKLETETSVAQPDGIPYGVVPGNHDYEAFSGQCPTDWDSSQQRVLSEYNNRFDPNVLGNRAYYGGSRIPGSNEDNYTLFESNGIKFIAINLGYHEGENLNGSPEQDWADALLKQHSDRLGIITSHYVMNCNFVTNAPGNFVCDPGTQNILGPYGAQVYQSLKDNKNLFMMLGAHKQGEAYRIETRNNMKPVHIMLANYQNMQYPGGNLGQASTFQNLQFALYGNTGFMRIMRFDIDSGANGEVTITTFGPPVTQTDAVTGDISVSDCQNRFFTYIPGNSCSTPAIPARNYLESAFTPANPATNNTLHTGTASNMTGIEFLGYTDDTTPDAFSFTNQSGVALNTAITSNSITVAGIDTAADISVSGGQYSIGSGAFTSVAGTVNNGQGVRVRVTSSASGLTTTSASLTIGGVSDTFSVTTVAGAANPSLVDQARFNGSVYAYGSGVTPAVAISGAPADTDYTRWATMHDKGAGTGATNSFRLYFMRQGSNTQLYQFGFNSATGRYEYGFNSIPTINITGAPADADPGSIAMLHDNSSFRLYMRSRSNANILYQFIFNGSTYAYVNALSVSGFPSNADWNGWGMLHDGVTYRLYLHNPIASDSMYQAALIGSTFVYGGSNAIPVLSITGMPAGSVRPDFGMAHDGSSFRFNYLR